MRNERLSTHIGSIGLLVLLCAVVAACARRDVPIHEEYRNSEVLSPGFRISLGDVLQAANAALMNDVDHQHSSTGLKPVLGSNRRFRRSRKKGMRHTKGKNVANSLQATTLLETTTMSLKKCNAACRDRRAERGAEMRLERSRRAAAKAQEGYQHTLMELKRKQRQLAGDLKGKQRDWEIQLAKLERARGRAERLVLQRMQRQLEMEFRLWRLKEERKIRKWSAYGTKSIFTTKLWTDRLKTNGRRTKRRLQLNMARSRGNRKSARMSLVIAVHDARIIRRNIKKTVRKDFMRNKDLMQLTSTTLSGFTAVARNYMKEQRELAQKIEDMKQKTDRINEESKKARDAVGDAGEAIQKIANNAGKCNEEYNILLKDFARVKAEHTDARNTVQKLATSTGAFEATNRDMNTRMDQARFKLKNMMDHFERQTSLRIEDLKKFLTSGNDASGSIVESALQDMLDQAKHYFEVELPKYGDPSSDDDPKERLLAKHNGSMGSLVSELAAKVTEHVKNRLDNADSSSDNEGGASSGSEPSGQDDGNSSSENKTSGGDDSDSAGGSSSDETSLM